MVLRINIARPLHDHCRGCLHKARHHELPDREVPAGRSDPRVFVVEAAKPESGLSLFLQLLALMCRSFALRATSVFSVSLWCSYFKCHLPQRHREHRGCTEKRVWLMKTCVPQRIKSIDQRPIQKLQGIIESLALLEFDA